MKLRSPLSRLAAVAVSITFTIAADSVRASTTISLPGPDTGTAGLLSASSDFIEVGALYLEGPMTIEADSTTFHFTTFEMAPGSSLSFVNLRADDTLRLIASESIRIRGELIFAPAGGLYIEAPLVEFGEGALIEAPGGSITLVATRGINNGLPSGGPLASGGLILGTGASIDVSGSGQPVQLDEGIQLRAGGSLSIAPGGGIVTAQAPIPEPETWAMLLAGLGMVGFAAVRRKSVKR
ncbi:PEPxxWA-CTERM sorting domain-containing protein [Thiobacillus sp.]|uniref:PEPxxWA-CTERM sorting domain-containing protein n=1 Tax=Thiobacillus sp. TaxID=924 RepID=UPI0025D6C807|nr:PEPxxWA-CTERM sorting domain-containing protein [Thiobacillus sp.]